MVNGKYIFNVHWPNSGANRGLLHGVRTTMGGFEPTTFHFESDNTNHCAMEDAQPRLVARPQVKKPCIKKLVFFW